MTESRIAPPVRVLVADTSAAFRKTVAEALTKKGFVVEISEAAEDAFNKVRVFEPDVIFYDTEVPGYEGFEALTLISKTRAGKEGFLIATSRQKGGRLEAQCLEAGARAFMRKPVEEAELLETALMIKRHVQRPKELPQGARRRALKMTLRKCGREGCESHVAAFTLKGELKASRKDQFETPIYAGRGGEVEYNLVCVSVCPACYFAVDEAVPVKKPAGSARRPGADKWSLMRIASEADDTLFAEERTPVSAVVAYRLAIENLQAESASATMETAGRLADLHFKAASVAHRAGDERLRDRFLADAERISTPVLSMEPCAAVYRAAYRLVAVYVFFARDLDAARISKTFDGLGKPGGGRMKPRDFRVLETYRLAAAEIMAQKHFYRRANYLAKQ